MIDNPSWITKECLGLHLGTNWLQCIKRNELQPRKRKTLKMGGIWSTSNPTTSSSQGLFPPLYIVRRGRGIPCHPPANPASKWPPQTTTTHLMILVWNFLGTVQYSVRLALVHRR